MPVTHPLPEEIVELLAKRFHLIGEPMRIRLLDRLRGDERSVGELADALEASQQNVSKHLAILHRAGIVRRRKDGNRVVYAIADSSVFTLCETVCGELRRQVADMRQTLAEPRGLEGAIR